MNEKRHRLHHADHPLSEDMHDILQKLKAVNASVQHTARCATEATNEQLHESYEKAKRKTKTVLREKPIQTLGIAILAGFIMGFLFRK